MKKILIIFMFVFLAGCESTDKEKVSVTKPVGDKGIALEVSDALAQEDREYFSDVNVTVFGKRVMLVGSVKNKAEREEVIAKARAVKGVREVIDFVSIEGDEEGKTGFSWAIHKEIVKQLLEDKNISGNNFKTVVYKQIAYVLGQAKTGYEKNKALRIIQNTDGVMGAKHNIIIK